MAIPKKDADCIAWGANFLAKVTPTPGNYSMTAAQCTALQALYDSYQGAYQVVAEAREAGARSKELTSTKDLAKAAFLQPARNYYADIQASVTIAPPLKETAGVVVKKTSPTPPPIPADAPEIDIIATTGRTASLRLHQADSTKRAKPTAVIGAAVFSYVGTSAPAEISAWQWQGNTGKTRTNVTFPASVPAGATVWFTAVWFNNRKETGPMAQPKSTNLPGGSVSMAS